MPIRRPIGIALRLAAAGKRVTCSAASRDGIDLPLAREPNTHECDHLPIRRPARHHGVLETLRQLKAVRTICPAPPQLVVSQASVSNPILVPGVCQRARRDGGQHWDELRSVRVIPFQLAPGCFDTHEQLSSIFANYRTSIALRSGDERERFPAERRQEMVPGSLSPNLE